jgi:putative DNA primase/helicase
MSENMKKVIRQYEKDNDLVLQFLEEKCVKVEDGGTKAKALYDAYKIWCRSNGYFVMSAKKFNANLETHPEWHNGKRLSHGYAVFDGVSLKMGS